MWLTGLRFALLVWIPGLLHAVSEKPCGVPNLEYGYFIPVQESYPHDSHVTYTCDAGYKTTKEGWWVTIVCQDGHWSEKPECALETACLPPVIPNGKFMQYQNGSFEINCDKGYFLNSQNMECHSGTWSKVSSCQRQTTACGQPPAVPDAVVIQAYQEVFEASSKVEYQCRDGFVTEGRQSKKIANCTAGEWVGTPHCIPIAETGSTDTQPFVSIDNCGKLPQVTNGLSEPHEQRYLKYTCQEYYKLVGPDTVVCHTGGTWSEVPTCKEDFCLLNTTVYPDLLDTTNPFIRNGDTEERKCLDKWRFTNYAVVRCIEMKLSVSRCCNKAQINFGTC
ncbi:complement factor H-like [Gambusia affinis]|uniref:complement factor H-like n=1 Tax=Gambusia affinis TaxID=33528 RepID=UPI001CDD4457|nr:complement factor H-like [Gambusia affinis]